jgi:hypothetical protein
MTTPDFGTKLESIKHIGDMVDGKMVCRKDCPSITHRNTPDTEWEKSFGAQLEMRGIYGYPKDSIIEDVRIQLSSRDTYWEERVSKKDDLLDDMWGLICNVNGGIVENEKEEWYQAFLRIRTKYFTNLDNLK